MTNEIMVLSITAASIGFFHTLFGPDHYLPFIVMAKAKKWSYAKTMVVTFVCGLAHVLSSVVLGVIGVGVGIAVSKLEIFEGIRGEWAGWALMTFGLVYFVYGIRQVIKNKTHVHQHIHADGSLHTHKHTHHEEHAHVHEQPSKLAQPIPWALFVIFILGPCEPLIPLLMYPAAKASFAGMVFVAAVFSVTTISTMMAVVIFGTFGLSFVKIKPLERFSHAFAGAAILFCGVAIKFLGL